VRVDSIAGINPEFLKMTQQEIKERRKGGAVPTTQEDIKPVVKEVDSLAKANRESAIFDKNVSDSQLIDSHIDCKFCNS
jgi:hypothetical protein